MRALLLAAVCAVPAGAWSFAARSAEAIYEVDSTGNPTVDNELAERAAAALKRRLAAHGLSGGVERRAGLRVAVTISSRSDDPEVLLRR
ncbi:MAG: hypothetical protein M0D55_15780 [Elusimicrobiota bacterium]|nr:MAG: hypothetical protein M0D55_15780 [Elusimicrobiota bacterium]